MAKSTSVDLESTYRFPRFAHLHFKIKLSPLRSRWRRLARQLFPSAVCNADPGTPKVVDALEKITPSFRSQGWAYIDGMWDRDFHGQLVAQWPNDRYFIPIKYITKSYDVGMTWSQEMTSDPEFLDSFPAYKAAYDYLRSPEFCARVTELAGDGVKRKCSQIILTRAYWGSSIIPHIDSSNFAGNVNFVMFVNGTGGERGGGLGIWKDNEFKEKIFAPDKLKNTCIVYDMSDSFYHGFEPMAFGKFRCTINSTYVPVKN